MWLPLKVQELNYPQMKAAGLELPAKELYNESEPSVHDAIVQLGNFCTAEIISPEGLILTNHHCGYDAIASQSSEENDYLTDGFWAMKRSEELPIDGLTISLLKRSEDLTERLNKLGTDAGARQRLIKDLTEKASEDGKYKAVVKEMFHGSETYLFVYEVYRDIRLVGAPPSSIGKYGGDTDNWMWPRHTGDFSLFRIYANANNEPADYSSTNQPYKPKHFLPISLNGVQEEDYAMVMGYPGSTDRYLTSHNVKMLLDQSNMDKYKLMGQKLDIMKEAMRKSDKVRIALASDYASLANYYKYLEGQTLMLNRYDIPAMKRQEEEQFMAWAKQDATRKDKYEGVLKEIENMHQQLYPIDRYVSYVNFGAFASQAALLSLQVGGMKQQLEAGPEAEERVKEAAAEMLTEIDEMYENFFPGIEEEIFATNMHSFYADIPEDMRPDALEDIMTSKKAKKGKTSEEKYKMWTAYAFNTSVVTDKERMRAFLQEPTLKAIEDDPIVNTMLGVYIYYLQNIRPQNQAIQGQLEALRMTYVQGLREWQDQPFYPDANSTMRVTYGKVLPYLPKDGVKFDYLTTIKGIMEKEDPTNPEFVVPEKLKALYAEGAYGRYEMNGTLPVNFLTTNDITGGNSGSPVINGKGELIGCAFDGNWEAMASDIHVFSEVTRTIAVDARYILFIIDKFAGAGHLIDEMKIVE
ncbi:MAG: S46 family peptidase [Bacteroidota bacterium]